MFQKIFVIATLAIGAMAQTVKTGITDGATPPAIQPGAPIGAVAPSQLERINLYNGHLSVVVPILSIGGRGEAGYTISVRVSTQPWTAQMSSTAVYDNSGTPTQVTGFNHNGSYSNAELRPYQSNYSPGIVYRKRAARTPYLCANAGAHRYDKTLSHIVFEEPDGTQHELYDGTVVQTGAGCNPSATIVTRGPRFQATDGSGITYTADATFTDSPNPLDPHENATSGVLLFPNGTRYTVVDGKITEIKDRNGNRTKIEYFSNGLDVHDSQDRITTVRTDVYESSEYVDLIRYKGRMALTTRFA